MVQAKADLTESPTIDTNNPAQSLKDSVSWVAGAGFLVFLFSLATGVVTPALENVFSSVTGVNTNESSEDSGNGLLGEL